MEILDREKMAILTSKIDSVVSYDDIEVLAREYGVGPEFIRNRLRKMGRKIQPRSSTRGRSIEHKERVREAIRLRYAEEGPSLIARDYEEIESYIMSVARKMGVRSLNHRSRVSQTQTDHNYNCNYSVFDPPLSNEAAYFLGLLWADGKIVDTEKGAHYLSLNLTEPEWPLLHSFREFMGCSLELGEPYREKESYQWKRQLTIGNKILVRKLISRGILPRKSYIDPEPLRGIPDEVYHHFARGWFDGDGSLTYCGGVNLPTPRVYYYGSHKALTDLRDNIIRLVGVSHKELYPSHNTETNRCWGVNWSSWEDVHCLIWWMNRDGGTYAGRKHDRPIRQLNAYLAGLPYKHLP